jgi:hypothetical protein
MVITSPSGYPPAKAGAAGVDRVRFAAIEAAGQEGWLAGLREDLVLKRYRPAPGPPNEPAAGLCGAQWRAQ